MAYSKLPQYLTQEELKRLLEKIDSKRDTAIIYTAYRHGLRASEVALLQKSDIDLERMEIRVTRLKDSQSGVYPLDPKTARHLKAYLKTRKDNSPILFRSRNGHGISRTRLFRLFQAYARSADVPEQKRHFHVLKHSIATHLLDGGSDIAFVQHWVGHKNIQNTRIYAQLTTSRINDEARRVFASPKIV